MGVKRKSRGTPAKDKEANSAFESRSGSKLKLSTWEDVMDSEDEFLEGREQILLDEGPIRKRVRKIREEEELLEASDEEVLGVPDSDEDEDEDEDEDMEGFEITADEDNDDLEITGKKTVRDEDEDEEGWGTSRKDLYGDDELETEEAALAHEAEARRIQQKQLEEMNDEDFGFGDQDWGAGPAQDELGFGTEGAEENFLERLPEATIADDASPEARIKLLRERYPEFEPLKREFIQLQEAYLDLKKEVERDATTISIVKYQALSSYLGMLAMYFALLTSTATDDATAFAKPPTQLRDHDVMQGLVQSRSTWAAAQALMEPELSSDESSDSEQQVIQRMKIPKTSRLISKKKKSTPLSATEVAQAASEVRRAARLAAVEADLVDLDSATIRSSMKKVSMNTSASANGDDSDLGDDTELNAYEAAAKAAKRKSLRFYTSEITQKANRRSARGREVGGDTDVPHRERWRDRQLRQQADAERRKEMLDRHRPVADSIGSKGQADDEQDNDYQDLVSRAAKVKAAKKASATDAYTTSAAARDAGYLAAEDVIGVDGKRKITYQIEKNKGLAPHRKKDVRNPRVKKRNKYEEKKKKLGSTKAVYKGGPGKGGYQGELTGIKTGLVKSIKLS